MTESEIKDLIIKRKDLLESDMRAADLIEESITMHLKNQFNTYPCDFIIETLTEFGQAPNIMYDDNGHFAVSDSCYAPVSLEPVSGEFIVCVRKEQWKDTIREAIWYYLNR